MSAASRARPRPLVAASFKAYLSAARTRAWVRGLAARATEIPSDVDVAVLPSFPMLESTAGALAGTHITWGAQDVAPTATGAQTGEVTAELLAELGCRYVEVGHAERRELFGEDPAMLAAKVREADDHGMTAVYCLGESSHDDLDGAVRACTDDVDRLLTALGTPPSDLVIAYEPLWAIGADRPADPGWVRAVTTAVRDRATPKVPGVRVLYGGAAGPGTFTALIGGVDGLLLGRFAHDLDAMVRVIREVAGSDRAASTNPDAAPGVSIPPAGRSSGYQ
ncbi:MAG TPA: triose-phosphate isomerase family protein [Propionibacteriaceae bacterium]|nr:triose-phosphate isomerase family protein [Propionibacteriaceae bacterium]